MRWMWIDRITELEKGVRCVAIKNVSLAEEHLHDHFPRTPVMPGPLIIEGMAQTAGILVGHARDFQEKVILAKVGKAILDRDVFPGHTLRYTATLDRIDASGASATGTVELLDHTLKVGDPNVGVWQPAGVIELMFSHIDQNMRGLGFPEHNFVFTDQFMDLLRNSGMK
jgi:3-hydroxyacyl-[acyl-carrier-protein] dehydratase